MNNKLSDEQSQAVLQALNEALAKGPWEKSAFLKAIGKNLTEIRDEFLTQVGLSSAAQAKPTTDLATRMALRSGQKEIYISLYSSDGINIRSWERIIVNLPRQMISRPIYANEPDIKAMLQTKENKTNEAYVAVYIKETDVLPKPQDKILLDKLGKELIVLKDNTVNLENISQFVHMNEVYHLNNGRLIKTSETTL